MDVRRLNSDMILDDVFLIVRSPTLKNYYAKTIKDRELILVALSFKYNVLNRRKK